MRKKNRHDIIESLLKTPFFQILCCFFLTFDLVTRTGQNPVMMRCWEAAGTCREFS